MIRIDPYYTMAFMGLLAALATQYFNFSQSGFKKTMTAKILFLTFLSFLAGVAGAVAGYWQNEGIFRLPPDEWFEHIGLTAYHGMIAASLFFILGCLILKLDIRRASSTAIPSLVIFFAFGRVGCCFAGCCHGIPLSFTFLGHQFDRFPTAQLESLFFSLLFIALQLYIKKRRVVVSMTAYAIFRFFNEFLRGDDRGTLIAGSGLSPAQIISLTLITVTLGAMLYLCLKRKFGRGLVLPADKQVKGGVRI
jgi:phosphatidylglycerol:prolipoprotein diacylglycerol transferase